MLFPPPQRTGSPLQRVVVTGAGIITGLGCGWAANAEGFRTGRKVFRPVTRFDTSRQRCQLAAEADPPAPPATRLPPKLERRLDRAAIMLLLAAHEAWSQAGWRPADAPAIVLGTTSGEMAFGQAYLRQALAAPAGRREQATRVVHYLAPRQGLDLCDAFGFQAPVSIIANACASGANAIGQAFQLVRTGRAARALTGGYDALSHLTFAGFDALHALSPTGCRPFAAGRDGLLLGEGAALLALESLAGAQARGATILGEILGYGTATDTHHLTQPHPDGDAALAAMNRACAGAGLRPDQLDYINAHGTATPQNDATEAAALNRWAGADAARLAVSSTKAGIGHLLGAAGAVEAVACLMALRGQWLPPQVGDEPADPACRFNLVRKPTPAALATALSNSFGFGGANACLIFGRGR